MKKKIILVFVMISLVGTLAGCQTGDSKAAGKADQSKPQVAAQSQTENNDYTLKKETYTEKNDKLDINVEYPQIEGLADPSKQKDINTLIKNEALAFYIVDTKDLEPIEKYEVQGTYTIKLKNDKVLSIAYSSYNNVVPSAHPNRMFYTTNIDVKTGKKLVLDDFVPNIDTAFVEILKKSKYVGDIDQEYEKDIREQAFNWYETDEKVIEALYNADYSICVYVTKDALGFSMPVTHAAGDHTEFEISRNDLKNYQMMNWN